MIQWTQAMAGVDRDDLRPVYILRGSEHALTSRFIETIRSRVERLSMQQTSVLRFWFDDDGTTAAVRTCQSIGLFGIGDVVVLEQCLSFGSSNKVKADPADLEAYLGNPVEGRVLVITVPEDAWDERKKLVKLAKTHAVIDCTTPKPEGRIQIVEWIAREKAVNITRPAVAEIVRRTHKVTMAERELEKLAAYAAGRAIQQDDVEQVVPLPVEDNVFSWIGAIMDGKANEAFTSAKSVLLAGNDAMGLLALIARQVRLMWYANWGARRNLTHSSIASQVGAHPYAVKVAGSQAAGVSLTYLERLLTIVADAEYAVKSGRRDPGQALDWVVMSCLATKHERRRAL